MFPTVDIPILLFVGKLFCCVGPLDSVMYSFIFNVQYGSVWLATKAITPYWAEVDNFTQMTLCSYLLNSVVLQQNEYSTLIVNCSGPKPWAVGIVYPIFLMNHLETNFHRYTPHLICLHRNLKTNQIWTSFYILSTNFIPNSLFKVGQPTTTQRSKPLRWQKKSVYHRGERCQNKNH